MTKFIFKSTNFSAGELEAFLAEVPPIDPASKRHLRVSSIVRNAAENKVLEIAKELAFTQNKSVVDCISHVMSQPEHEAIARISRGLLVRRDNADVDVE
jgi:hypothetical protein